MGENSAGNHGGDPLAARICRCSELLLEFNGTPNGESGETHCSRSFSEAAGSGSASVRPFTPMSEEISFSAKTALSI